MSNAHLLTFQGQTFTPDGRTDIPADRAHAINEQTNARELEFWATAPIAYAPAYYAFPSDTPGPYGRASWYPVLTRSGETPARVTTWFGTTIGTIVYARVFRHNFGGRMLAIRVQGTNGAYYVGRASFDNGTMVRLRKVGRS